MTYVISDVHGQYEKFRQMLDRIRFTDRDELFVLGDVVDRGEGSAELLADMSVRGNVFPLLGNHDCTALYILRRLCVEISEDNVENQLDAELMKAIVTWQTEGGDSTIRAFRALPQEEREALLDYMEEFSPYEELVVGGKRFVLVHGGLPDFHPDKPLSDYPAERMITERPDYTRRYFPDAYLVTGHTPTCMIDPAYEGRVYRKNGHIAVDCGAGFGMSLGCIRLDDFEEFYV